MEGTDWPGNRPGVAPHILQAMRAGVAALAVVVAVLGSALPAAAEGPALSVPRDQLKAALSCPGGFSHHERDPVLLVHGTFITPEESWSTNYARALPPLGYDVCTVRLPGRAVGDIQVSSEYVVYAIRRIAARSGRKVDVIGHSQGTVQPRWAVKWWPDVRRRVDDYVSLAGPHHGINTADGACVANRCAPAIWQMRHGSRFLTALNAGDETPDGPDYTSIYSQTDELVTPPSTAPLSGASNFPVQSLCPARIVHHGGLLYDNVVFAAVMDALTHPGGTDPSRLSPTLCASFAMPGSDPVDTNLKVYGNGVVTLAKGPFAEAEPPLKPYAR